MALQVARNRSVAFSECAFGIDGASLIGKAHYAFDKCPASHLCHSKPIHLIAEPGSPSAVPKALDPAVDLAAVQGLEDLVRLHVRLRAGGLQGSVSTMCDYCRSEYQQLAIICPMDPRAFRSPICLRPYAGLPAEIGTVEDAKRAIASLPKLVRDRVHWRLAASMLRLAADEHNDVDLARRLCQKAFEYEGWAAGE